MKDIIAGMKEQAGVSEVFPRSQQRRIDIQARARAEAQSYAQASAGAPTRARETNPIVEQAANSFHQKDAGAFGALDMIVKAGQKENKKEIKHHPDRKMVETYVPPKMRGTPLEGLIIETGGGTSNTELGIPGTAQAPSTPIESQVVSVPGMEQFLEQPEKQESSNPGSNGKDDYSDENRLSRLRRDAESMVESLGGKVVWES